MTLLRIVRGLGGNGSTFVARAIAAIENVVLLSETNPLAANLFSFALNPAVQIEANYGHLNFAKYAGHIAELGAPAFFGRYIDELLAQCAAIDHHLVIRDYNYADYIGLPFVLTAPFQSSLDMALGKADRREILLVRHPIAQFCSLAKHAELANALEHKAFLKGYRALLDNHGGARMTLYEDLFADFDNGMRLIAEELQLPLAEDAWDRLPETGWVTGHEAGRNSVRAEPVPLDLDDEARRLFLPLEDYRVICTMCGYEV